MNSSAQNVIKFKKITRNNDHLSNVVLSNSDKFFQSIDSGNKTPIRVPKKIDPLKKKPPVLKKKSTYSDFFKKQEGA